MASVEIQVTDQDLSEVLRVKTNEVTNLQIQLATLSRVVSEKSAKIEEMEKALAGLNGKEAVNAESMKEKVPVHG